MQLRHVQRRLQRRAGLRWRRRASMSTRRRSMKHVRLGRSGLRVSPLCLGTMNFGPLTNEADSHAIMDKAVELGINFFDTANVYGWKTGEGVTEQIVGRWIVRGG